MMIKLFVTFLSSGGLSVIGPFSGNPFSVPMVISPLNSAPKPDTSKRRIILDLSWLTGSLVNDGIPEGCYLSQPYSLIYPIIDTILLIVFCSLVRAVYCLNVI